MNKFFAHILLSTTALVTASCQADTNTRNGASSEKVISKYENNAASKTSARPNILFIIADDMGYADLGSFGSEISTPNLDKLALSGIRFTDFNASPVCSVTRAMLLTGVSGHKAGLGNMAEELAPNQKDKPGYEGHINDRVLTLAEILNPEGYASYYSGKWHLGSTQATSPASRGFDNSFVLLSGGASHFPDMRPAYHPDPKGLAPYQQDGETLKSLPPEFEFSSQYYADYLSQKIKATSTDTPVFAVLGFTAPHWPLQAPETMIDQYAGKYDHGYDQIAQTRLVRQLELGLLPPNSILSNPSPKYVAWDKLPKGEQMHHARAMEIYAAMVEDMDTQVATVIKTLKETGRFENTIIVFLSDNGAEGHDLDETWPADLFPGIRRNIDQRHDFSFENMGKPNSYVFYGPGWSRASAPAFHLHKGFPTEGGIRVAAFMHYPGFEQSRVLNEFITIKDIVPTLLDITNIDHPSDTGEWEAPTGQSVLPLLESNGSTSDEERVYIGEVLGKYFVRKGHWKLVHVPSPHGTGAWQLYDLRTDISEKKDVTSKHPNIVSEMNFLWESYKHENGVILPNQVSGY